MNRQQLEHVCGPQPGSREIRTSLPSVVDVTFFGDPDDTKSDQVNGAIGALSAFHETCGYYAQGVSITTAQCR